MLMLTLLINRKGWVYNMLKSNKQQGFTIIEVVLVLAIAGLIFLTVFLALPALQKSQRDNARKADVGNVVSALQSYLSDNNALPTNANSAAFLSYASTASMAQAASGVTFGVAASATTTRIAVNVGTDCAGNVGARQAAVNIVLESNGTTFCKSV